MLNKFNAAPKLLMTFASKDTLSLMPTFLGRTVQTRSEGFVEKLPGGSDQSILDMAVSKQFASQLLFAHFANLLHFTGSESRHSHKNSASAHRPVSTN
jgi:hypothetical protein